MSTNVRDLADLVGGEVIGDAELLIQGVADLRRAGPSDIGFVREVKYGEMAKASGAGAALVSEDLGLPAVQIVVKDPAAAFAKIALTFHPVPRATEHSVHPSASVDPKAELQSPVQIGPMAVIEAGAKIGAGSVISAGAVVGPGCVVGADCVLYPRVTLYAGTKLGDRVILHAGAVLGSDGFGYAPDGATWIKVPQLGQVVVEDDVEIGANSTVDCGTLGETRIGARSKVDNMVHIGHNSVLGSDNMVAGLSALSGSSIFGDRVHCGGHVVTAGHLKVADDVRVGGNSVIYGDIEEAGDYLGYPLQPKRRWGRTLRILDRLVELNGSVRELSWSKKED